MSVGFAKKLGMTRLFINEKAVPVTVLEVPVNYKLQTKTTDKEGYNSIQVGTKKTRKVTKQLQGHIKKALPEVESGFSFIAEFDNKNIPADKTQFDINDYSMDNLIDITGTTIGKGFTGAVKRWGFAGQPASHGHDHLKAVGSIGARWPQRVVKGKKMAGKHGNKGLTLKKVNIVAIDNEKSLLFVNGSVPGANSSYVKIQTVK